MLKISLDKSDDTDDKYADKSSTFRIPNPPKAKEIEAWSQEKSNNLTLSVERKIYFTTFK